MQSQSNQYSQEFQKDSKYDNQPFNQMESRDAFSQRQNFTQDRGYDGRKEQYGAANDFKKANDNQYGIGPNSSRNYQNSGSKTSQQNVRDLDTEMDEYDYQSMSDIRFPSNINFPGTSSD